MARAHSDFFQGLTERGLFDRPNHSKETQLSKQEETEKDDIFHVGPNW
jgi:hypothetical protein